VVQLAKTPVGFFVVAMRNQVVEFEELSNQPDKAAEQLLTYEEWVTRMKQKGYDIETDEPALDPMKVAELIGVSESAYLARSREVSIAVAKAAIKKHLKRDLLVVQTVGALDDLTKTTNMLMNRLTEWYGLHYPELKVEEDQEKYLKMMVQGRKVSDSMGMDLAEEDLHIIMDYADSIRELFRRKEALEAYLDRIMAQVAPNVHVLAGANLGARLIARAGGLEALSRMPGSTIQVLGAEKALFKHILKGVPPPKHGVIFQHPLISRAPREQRGKLARSMATRLAIAAKVDFYSGDLRPSLMDGWAERVKEVEQGETKKSERSENKGKQPPFKSVRVKRGDKHGKK